MSKFKFNRSAFMKQRHQEAKIQRKVFAERFGDERGVPSYSSFLKNDTPLVREIISYDVSFQVSYRGSVDDITINPVTFTVYGFKEDKGSIENKTMNMVIDSKGVLTGNNLPSNTITAIENNTDIQVKPRGMEENQRKPSRDIINSVVTNNFVVKDLDTNIKMKNRKGRTGDLNLDIRHFI